MATDDDSEIPESGAVFTFGKSKFADNLPNKFWVRNDEVHSVSCGDEHTVLVAESGRIFSFGSNDWGQLGLGHSKMSTRPTCIKSLKHEKITLVACGNTHTVVATESKRIYTFGNNNEKQLGLDGSNAEEPKWVKSVESDSPFQMLMAGADHSVALTADGKVFVWGGGGEGQLGLGQDTEDTEPTELPLDDKAICIGCGYYHTAVVTDAGDLYTFGENDTGKLGLGDSADLNIHEPQKVSIPEKVKWVSCGGTHTVAVTVKGHVYTFGEGSNGQLGHGTEKLCLYSPLLLKLDFKVSSASCGESHTALITEKGQLYTFGDGRHGKLGLGQESVSNEFKPCKCSRFSNFFVEKVSCGGCHMVVIAKPKVQNGYSAESEDEIHEDLIDEEESKALGNHIKPDDSIDLNNSVSARERRRQLTLNDANETLSRTLPSLGTIKGLPSLNSTVPPIKVTKDNDIKKDAVPNITINGRVNDKKSPGHSDYESDDDHSDMSDKENLPNDVQDQNNNENDQRPHPRPVPRRPLPVDRKQVKEENEENKEDESEESEEENETKKPSPVPRKIDKIKEKEDFDSEEDNTESEKEDKQSEHVKKALSRQEAIEKAELGDRSESNEDMEEVKKPKKKVKKKMKKKQSEEDVTEVQESESKKQKDDSEDEDEVLEDSKKNKKKVKKKKKAESEDADNDGDSKKKKTKGKKKKGKQSDETKEEETKKEIKEKDDTVSPVEEKDGEVKNTSDDKEGEKTDEKNESGENSDQKKSPVKKRSKFCTIL